jgi:L-threonylcarbamoyladenylate synthase
MDASLSPGRRPYPFPGKPQNVTPVRATGASLARAAALLGAGGVVAFPTETVYGLGALAFDAGAVARIFEIKGRPQFDPLIVHVLDEAMLGRVASEISDLARRLMTRFWPGGLTLVFPKRGEVPGLVTAGLPTVAVRQPAHPVARALLEAAGSPIAAPSANLFGGLSPTRAAHVADALGDRVDLILDGGPSSVGLESTILALDPKPMLLRAGAVEIEEIEAEIGPVQREVLMGPVLAPGGLPVHYAPRTPLRVIDPRSVKPEERAGAGALLFREDLEGYAATRVLSPRGDLRDAAAGFFEALHAIDARGLERIDAEPMPERGLGLAIMDRLRRASARG